MIALKEQWRQQRQQRQQELAQRQHDVRETLATLHHERQVMASQLRDDLSLFQAGLQKETHNYLNRVSHQRQLLAEQLIQELQAFVQILRSETADFLGEITADRTQKAEELARELSDFHQQLNVSVAALREQLRGHLLEIQEETWVLRADTQTYLTVQNQQRMQLRIQVLQRLQTYVESLQTEVSEYLVCLERQRQERSQQLQTTFRQQYESRMLEMDVLFQELSEFRASLRSYCAALHDMVWGDGAASEGESAAVAIQKNSLKPAATSVPPRKPGVDTRSAAPAAPKPTPAVVPGPPAPAPVPEATPVLETSHATRNGTLPTLVMPPGFSSPHAQEPLRDSMDLEEEIYNFIYTSEGARLTAIESALGLNRFQAVDALRSLIKKGLVTQRDRVYLIQEDIDL